MKQPIAIEITAKTDDGIIRKGHNEDNFMVSASAWGHAQNRVFQTDKGSLLMVADGMGGTNAGEVASEIAVKSVENSIAQLGRLQNSDKSKEDFLIHALESAHNNILQHAQNHPESAGMGTTAILVWILDNKAHIAWCGDSRCYIYRKGISFRPRTDDHSLVWKELVGDNYSPEKAETARLHQDSNIITQSLGDKEQPPKPSSKTVELQTSDRIIVCSDGLNAMVSDRDILAIVSRLDFSPKQICDQLIIAANAAGGRDNITVITADFDVNNTEVSEQKAIKDFQESSSIEKTKKIWLFGGILTVVLVTAAGLWFTFSEKAKTAEMALAALEKIKKDSIHQAQVEENRLVDKAADKQRETEDEQKSKFAKISKGQLQKEVEKMAKRPQNEPPQKKEPEPIAKVPDEVVQRMRKLVDKRSDIGDFLKKFKEDKLTAHQKQTLKQLREEGTRLQMLIKNEGIIIGEARDINTSFNKISIISDLEKKVNALEKKVQDWRGDLLEKLL
jgi:serine/threonine protein phosphatase PrpC